jgi:cell wall-associated NlpC family hydrolase
MPRLRPRIEFLLVIAGVSQLPAQSRAVDVLYGRWYHGNESKSYELRTQGSRFGIVTHGLALEILVHDSLGRRRAFYGAGWQLQAWRGRATLGPYAVAGLALGLSTDTSRQQLAALWSIGAGIELRPVSSLALSIEGAYRLQDVGPRGFWHPSPEARRGISGALGISLTVGSGSRARQRSDARGKQPAPQPPPQPPLLIIGNASTVVRTALDVIGSPYVWGGTAANGFDCSGLVQWAYAQHGIRLPRMSRDQARSGSEVPPVVAALLPGDILLFAAQPGGGVTHVGMYVGEQTFIHSSNSGVKLSRLEATDVDGAWWVARWVGARRVMP